VSPIKVNSGHDKQALALAGGAQAGYQGTATATTATSLTATGTPWTTNQWAGKFVVTGTAYGVVVSNSSSVLTIDRWYAPATPTGSAASTPSGTSTFVILGGAAPVFYMALTANATAPSASDTALTGEITTSGGGLIRQAAAYAHTAGASTYTLTGTFTANGSDSLPVTIAKIGTFDTLTGATGVMLHETLLSATATLSAVSDALTVTQTVTM
jgi:hypothetical protein